MIPQWWLHLLKGEKITFYNLHLFDKVVDPHQHVPYRRHRNTKFLAPSSQRFARTPTDWLLNPSDIVGSSNRYWRPRGRWACYLTISTSAMSFKLLDQLENLTPVWKFVEAELPSEPCLNNLERLRFVICLGARWNNLTKQVDFSQECNLSSNNLHAKSTVAQYSICNLNWQDFTFHNLALTKQTGKTSFLWSEFHKIVWQNFVRTSHFLYFLNWQGLTRTSQILPSSLTEINSNKLV